MPAPHPDLHDLSLKLGGLIADNESAKSQRADLFGGLGEVKEELAGIAAVIKTLPDQIKAIGDKSDAQIKALSEKTDAQSEKITVKLDTHAEQDNARLTKLEHDATRAKATIKTLMWGGGVLGAANVWAIIKGGFFGLLR